MEVRGTLNVTVDVSKKDCLKVVLHELGYRKSDRDSGLKILEADDRNNETGKRGIFRWTDISYHGSPTYEYELVSNDPIDIEKFEIALRLKELLKY